MGLPERTLRSVVTTDWTPAHSPGALPSLRGPDSPGGRHSLRDGPPVGPGKGKAVGERTLPSAMRVRCFSKWKATAEGPGRGPDAGPGQDRRVLAASVPALSLPPQIRGDPDRLPGSFTL